MDDKPCLKRFRRECSCLLTWRKL